LTRRFVLISRWRLRTTPARLWELLVQPADWPAWWPHLATVRQLAAGDREGIGARYAFCWRSGIGYTLRIVMTTVRAASCCELEGAASGDVSGIGLWLIEPDGPDALRLTYRWDIELDRPWMRLCAPLLRAVFARRHFAVMAAGARGMARQLACTLDELEEWSAITPAAARRDDT